MELDRNSTVIAIKDQLSSNLGAETVVLNLTAGVYCGMDAVGARIWALVQEPRRVPELCATLMGEYEVDADRCERAVLEFLRELDQAGLIEATDEPAA